MKEIIFAEDSFLLHPSGLMIWPTQKMAIVSDLHLEKGSFFAAKGQMIPPHDSHKTLKILFDTLDTLDVKKIILLGDSFHDNAGFERLDDNALKLFNDLFAQYKIIWIRGNHDDAFFPKNVDIHDDIKIGHIVFRHEAEKKTIDYEVSGHYHPKASIKMKGRKIKKACFIHSEKRIIMPALGVYTGGLDINNAVIAPFLPKAYYIHMLGHNNIYTFKGGNKT